MKQDRRDFLRKTAAASAGIAIFPSIVKASSLGLGENIAPSDKKSMIVIGCGVQGGFDLRQFLRMDDVQVIAVCDVDDSHSASAKQRVDNVYGNSDCRIYKDFREILEKENPDTALLALPDHWHSIIYCAVANKRIDVYAEKPLARTIAGSRAIVDAVQKNNIVWQTGSHQRSQERFRIAAELVRNGRIGEIEYIEVGMPDGIEYAGNPPVQPVPEGVDWDMWLGPAPKVPYRGVMHWNWRWIMDYSGGHLTDWAGHHIDIAHWGIGMDRSGPVSIEGKGRSNRNGIYNTWVEYDVRCKYRNGIEMRVANVSKLKHGMGIAWYGTEGWLYVDRGRILEASDPGILEGIKLGRFDKYNWYDRTNREEIRAYYLKRSHHRNFIDCVLSREETNAPAEIGHRSISAGLLGEIAIVTGQKLDWDPDKEVFINNDQASRLLKKPYRAPWKFPV